MARKYQVLAVVLVLIMQAASYAQSADNNGHGKPEGAAPANRMTLETICRVREIVQRSRRSLGGVLQQERHI